MRKRERLYLGLFALIIVLGVAGFVYSQTFLPSTGTVPNPGHVSEQILCVGCVDTANIKDGAILDGDVSNGAGVYTRKINGANGWQINTGPLTDQHTQPITQGWADVANTGALGQSDWNLAIAEFICESNWLTNSKIQSYGGSQRNYYKWNHNIVRLSASGTAGTEVEVYRAEAATNPSANYQSLKVRAKPGGPGILQFRKEYLGTPISGESEALGFSCVIKVLSLCPSSQQASCM